MKKLSFLSTMLFVFIYLLSCEPPVSQAEKDYLLLRAQADSLAMTHQSIAAEHEQLMEKWNTVMQQMDELPNPDSVMLQNAQQQYMLLSSHEQSLRQHEQVRAMWQEFDDKYTAGGVSEADIQAQVGKMTNEIQMMREAHQKLSSDHVNIESAFVEISEMLTKAKGADS